MAMSTAWRTVCTFAGAHLAASPSNSSIWELDRERRDHRKRTGIEGWCDSDELPIRKVDEKIYKHILSCISNIVIVLLTILVELYNILKLLL